ncbi:MAG: hypothetical protein K9K66_00405 [Desulfarculaceae bacterium]|nr:hypothetical protein [Desulfarculaceae bacterium]MCF8072172.1 hypothetical protein [Desulfarculaceae bacterium]MCF8100093.1 hypothetical protein [Desulfarculaceae bacterium]MCF8117932.1 hypothetical protein [Desulfarculaceae bacterium]
MSPITAGPRGLWLLSLALLWAMALASGCASVSTGLEKGYHALAQEEYFVKRQSKLYSRPDRTSSERGYALKGDKAVKLTGDVRGWSKVKVESRGVEGWLPAAALSSKPVSPATAKPKAAQKAPAAKAAPAPAPAEKKSGSILSPPSAEAAEKPPAQEVQPQRKADPKKFEAL